MRNTAPHKIITLTGNDRTGKTTQLCLLKQALKPSVTMKFPDPGHWTEPILRAILADETFDVVRDGGTSGHWYKQDKEATLFQYLNAVNRQAAQPYILETLQSSHILMDRYEIDTILYGVTEGMSLKLALEMIGDNVESDLAIILHGSGFGGASLWQDKNDANQNLQTSVVRTANGLCSVYSDRYCMLNVDQYHSTSSPVEGIWNVHKRVVGLVNRFLDLNVQPLELVLTQEILRREGKLPIQVTNTTRT